MEMRVVVNELVPVYEQESGERVVDARELHEFLKVSSRYNDWFSNRVSKYGFTENEDFVTLTKNLVSGGKQNQHLLKLDVAKEFCMVENNEQGSRARKYFIEVEKRLKNLRMDISQLSPELQMFHALFESQAKTQLQLVETQKQLASVTETIETMQETFLQRDEDWRKSINSMLNGAAFRSGSEYRNLRTESYRILEERAHCDLSARLRNLTKRLEDNGATKTQLKEANKMDVIETDPRLKEIYTTIVKEMSIGSLKRVDGMVLG